MPIILALAKTVKAYVQRFGEFCPELEITCPHCGGKTHKHGRYWRSAVTARAVVYEIPIYRWLCKDCRHTTSVLPDFLVPYAQFVSLVREGVLRRRLRGWTVVKIAARSCSAAAGGLSVRTVARWLARAAGRAANWTKLLTSRLLLARPGSDVFSWGQQWQGPGAILQALCELGDLCRLHAPAKQGHRGLYAYCSGLVTGLPRL